MTGIVDEARVLLHTVQSESQGEMRAAAKRALERLDAPLRVAIAGRIKAGKSTLLNAIIGQAAAATDATECTRVVTWYVDGTAYLAHALSTDGSRRQVPYRRAGTSASVDIHQDDLVGVERVEVQFPSSHLRAMTLIDTPGIASVSEQVSERATDFLMPSHADQGADVVVYLLRNVHERDADFLEAFTDPVVAPVGAARSIAVVSRADEIGNGRGDAMQIAGRVANQYAKHPAIRSRVADVLPVAGLLAFTGATLTENEFGSLQRLASMDHPQLEALMVSADRFTAESMRVQVPETVRAALLDRLGLFGVRLAVRLIRSGECPSAGALAAALEERSGIRPLRQTLLDRFAGRAEILKAARAIDWVAATAVANSGSSTVRREVERVLASSYELAEMQALGTVLGMETGSGFPDDDTRRAVLAALGNDGVEPWQRLGRTSDTVPEQLPSLIRARLDEFRSASMSPVTSRKAAELIGVAIRSLEAIHGELEPVT